MHATNLRIHFAVLALLSMTIAASVGKTIYVDGDAPGVNNGSSWENAYNFLQDALADGNSAPKPAEIRVAQGIYRPDEDTLHPFGTGNREATFQLINGVSIKGGYAGFGQPDPNARNVKGYETILSGDLDGNDVDVNQISSLLVEPTRAENSYHILTAIDCNSETVLDGFTIAGGNANVSDRPHYVGGGILIESGSPKLMNCIFHANASQMGGGMGVELGDPILLDCTFSENYAFHGGGLMNDGHSLMVTNCLFIRNCAQHEGGAARFRDGALINCTFIQNTSGLEGGAIDSDCARFALDHCLFIENAADTRGGAVSNYESEVMMTNCTFVGNFAVVGGAVDEGDSESIISNCIFWGNRYYQINEHGSESVITYCDVQGGWPFIDDIDVQGIRPKQEGNINVDPCFADPNNGDYHLKSQAGRWDPNRGRWVIDDVTSPCIDAGDPMSPIGYEPFPNGGRINMGAYGGTAEASKSYFGKPPCETIVAGDVNGDCIINFEDFRLMALHWCEDNN